MKPYQMVFLLIGVVTMSCNHGSKKIVFNAAPPRKDVFAVIADNSSINSIFCLDSARLFAATAAGSVLYSQNSGLSWSIFKAGDGNACSSITGDDKHLWITIGGDIYQNNAGGKDWKLIKHLKNNTLHSIYFCQATKILISAGTFGGILISKDCGKTWSEQIDPSKSSFGTIYCSASSHLWIGGTSGTILSSDDSGKHWRPQSLPDNFSDRSIVSICSDPSGNELWAAEANGGLLYSNGNNAWQQIGNINQPVNQLYFKNNKIYAACNSSIAVSPDKGKTWTRIIKNKKNAYECFGSNNNATYTWVGGKNGLLAEYDFVTNRLDHQKTGNYKINYLKIISKTRVFGLTSDGQILKSEDGGKSWNSLLNDSTKTFNAIATVDSGKTLWVVGDNGAIENSLDNGRSWTVIPHVPGENLNDINYDKGHHSFWIAGRHGLILNLNLAGNIITPFYPNNKDDDIADIKVSSQGILAISGNKIIQSSDNGKNWKIDSVGDGYTLSQIIANSNNDKFSFIANTSTHSAVISPLSTHRWDIQLAQDPEEIDNVIARFDDDNAKIWAVGMYEYDDYLYYSADGGKNWTAGDLSADYIFGDPLRERLLAITQQSVFENTTKIYWPYIQSIEFKGATGTQELVLKIPQYKNGILRYNVAKKLSLTIKDLNNPEQTFGFPLNAKFEKDKNDSTIYHTSIDPLDANIHPGEVYTISINVAQLGFTQAYPIPLKFTYKPWQWFITYKNWILGAALAIGYVMVLLLTWYFRPLTILTIEKKFPLKQSIAMLPPPFNKVLSNLTVFLPVSGLAKSKRVANFWTKKYQTAINEKFFDNPSVRLRKDYIPIPIELNLKHQNREIIKEPAREIIDKINQAGRNIIQIIGDGGSGKTTLSIQICRWLISRRAEKGTYSVIILVETATTDINKYLKEKIDSYLVNDVISKELLAAMLTNHNVICVVDALSEQSATMQTYINKIHGKVKLNDLIITSRNEFSFQEQDNVIIKPLALTSDKLMLFIVNYLEIKYHESDESETRDLPARSFKEQLRFAEKIGDLFDNVKALSPLLVKIIIDNLFNDFYEDRALTFDGLLDRMPKNIPDVYVSYLKTVNPYNKEADNYLQEETMLELAKLFGYYSIKTSFKPQDFSLKDIRELLDKKFKNLKKIDPVQRFIQNQVITKKADLTNYNLRFSLDPCAEYLGAFFIIEEEIKKKTIGEFYNEKVKPLDDAEFKGFKIAFLQIAAHKGLVFEPKN